MTGTDWQHRVVRLRKELGWTQQQLADHVHATRATVVYWERGRRPLQRFRIALRLLERETYGQSPDDPETTDWADRLRALRLRHGLSQAELGRRLGCSQRDVSSWESGRTPNVPMRARIEEVERQLTGATPQPEGDAEAAELASQQDRLRWVRARRGFTQGQLAYLLGVTQAMVSQVERGHRKLGPDALDALGELEADLVDTGGSLGVRLMAVRARYGMKQRQLADLLGVTQSMISLWERGQRGGTPEVMRRLVAVERGEHLNRPKDSRDARTVLSDAFAGLGLRDLDGAVAQVIDELPGKRRPEDTWIPYATTPAAIADELLAAADGRSPTVDVAALARRCGTRVLVVPLDAPLIGVYVDADDIGRVILLARWLAIQHRRRMSENTSREEQEAAAVAGLRFTAARGLGHMLLGHVDRVRVDLARVGFGALPRQSGREERDADDFAYHLLTPTVLVRRAHAEVQGRPDPLARLARTFGVDQLTMALRLASLDLRPLGLPEAQS